MFAQVESMTTTNIPLLQQAAVQTVDLTIDAIQPGTAIGPDLFGIFFEDLNWAADGGLYGELIQNRSFEYTSRDGTDVNLLMGWELVQRNGGKGSVAVETEAPLNAVNAHYAVLTVERAGVALCNNGFDGIVVKQGESYNLAFFARVVAGNPGLILVRLESQSGALLGEATFSGLTDDWTQFTASIDAAGTDSNARLVIETSDAGSVGLDVVSLFPQHTFRNRRNGLRNDLAQVIADLEPKFVRFPGGCLAHGDGLDNMYRWKDTIGQVEERKELFNIWGYHQTVGLGYFEYFQFCEDIGAKPLPVVPAGVCCQNSGAFVNGKWGEGQEGLPLSEMPEYVQEVLDLIEWANGPATSTWGAKRAAAGHPEPFHLEYLGVGNEDAQTETFRERFKIIYDAVKAKHPEITVIGTVGPAPDGFDYEEGWKFANELNLEMVDEHGYREPQWFLDNLTHFDAYDRSKSLIYLGEYAAHEPDRANTLLSALAEAAYMTSLERNGDIVRLSSYAPLLGREDHTQWRPDLIYFTGTDILLTANYYVQRLFSINNGDVYLPHSVSLPDGAGVDIEKTFATSCVKNSSSGDIILKLVNVSQNAVQTRVDLSTSGPIETTAACTLLTGDSKAVNSFQNPGLVVPATSNITVGETFVYEAPPYSLTVIRMKMQ